MINKRIFFKQALVFTKRRGYIKTDNRPTSFCHVGAPQGFWGTGENDYLFSGSWGALVIILGELGSKLIILGI